MKGIKIVVKAILLAIVDGLIGISFGMLTGALLGALVEMTVPQMILGMTGVILGMLTAAIVGLLIGNIAYTLGKMLGGITGKKTQWIIGSAIAGPVLGIVFSGLGNYMAENGQAFNSIGALAGVGAMTGTCIGALYGIVIAIKLGEEVQDKASIDKSKEWSDFFKTKI